MRVLILALLLTGCASTDPCAGETLLRLVPYSDNWQARMVCEDRENDAARIMGRR